MKTVSAKVTSQVKLNEDQLTSAQSDSKNLEKGCWDAVSIEKKCHAGIVEESAAANVNVNTYYVTYGEED